MVAEVIEMNSAIQAANERMIYLSGDEDAIRAYEVRFKAACDRTSAHNYALRKGMEKGEAKSTLKIARNLKKMGMPVSQIAEGTGLSPETIERL
jgi:predicted transposase/invertase (TIGR01784 family)